MVTFLFACRYNFVGASCLLLFGLGMSGCSSGPPALSPPDIDPAGAAQSAIEMYDTDNDSAISEEEANAAPELLAVFDRVDGDRNAQLAQSELQQFMQQQFIDAGAGAVRLKCKVYLDGREVPGAKVAFEPAPFFEKGALKPALGETDTYGTANVSVPANQLEDTAAGILPGLYWVRVSKKENGREIFPARFNTETTLGAEVARRAPYMPGALELPLSSR